MTSDALPYSENGESIIGHNPSWTAPELRITTVDGMSRRTIAATGPRYEGEVIVIGRGAEADIDLPDQHISRAHLRLVMQRGRITAEDMGSKWGTAINGRPLTGPCELSHGDCIIIGKTEVAFACYWEVLSRPARAPRRTFDASQGTQNPHAPSISLSAERTTSAPTSAPAPRPAFVRPIKGPPPLPEPWEQNLKIAALIVMALCGLYFIGAIFFS